MNSTDALREIAEKHKFGYQEYVDHVVSEYTALISEHYTERAKYDEAVRQRDELRERLNEAITTIKAIKAVNDATIKSTE